MPIVIGNKTVSNITIGGKTVSKIEIGGKTAYELEKVKNPSISCTNNVVTMTCATSGATIRYSTNGGSTYSTYSSPITISSTTTYMAYATKSGMGDSGVVSYTATYVTPKVPTPTIVRSTYTENGSTYYQFTITTSGLSGVKYYIAQRQGNSYNCSSVPNPTTSSSITGTGTGSNSSYTYKSGMYISLGQGIIKVLGTKSGYTNSNIACSSNS